MTGRARVRARGRARNPASVEPAKPEVARGSWSTQNRPTTELRWHSEMWHSSELPNVPKDALLSQYSSGLEFSPAERELMHLVRKVRFHGCRCGQALSTWISSLPLPFHVHLHSLHLKQTFFQTPVDGKSSTSLGLSQWLLFGEWFQNGQFQASVWTDWVG